MAGIVLTSGESIEYVKEKVEVIVEVTEVKENPFEVAKREAIAAEWATREGTAKEKAQKEYDRIMEEERVASDKTALKLLRDSLIPDIEVLEKKQGF